MIDSRTDSNEVDTTPAPRIKKRSGPSLVWLIPLVTALVGGWLIYRTLSEKGPEITIEFKTAEGIEAGKTKIKYKEIEIGIVDAVHFNEDFSRVNVKASMEKESAPFLRRGTRFWVVKPRLTLRGASNLGTLLSGVYIEIEPGQGAPQKHFVGLDVPPVIKADVAGIKVVLLTRKLGSIGRGSPVYYQGILAGETLGWELGNDRKSIFIYAFIKAPYDKLVKSNTRFWNVSGMDVSVGSEGFEVHTESIQALLYGGIAFETPDTLKGGKEDVQGLVFTLHDSYESIEKQAFTKKITFILFFEGSVRGLNVGAPVEFKGIRVGSVLDVRLEFYKRDSSFRIPVLIEIEPERIVERGEGEVSSPYETLKTLVDRGLRAQLQTGSLLTGQLFVDLDMHPDTPIRLVNEGAPFPELPTVPARMEQLTTSVKSILAKLERMETDKIGAELLETLQGTNRLMNKPELHEAVNDLKGSLHALESILHKFDQRVEPITTNLELTLDRLNDVLKPDSPLQYRFIELAEELAEMARSFRALAEMLEQDPNAIIFDKDS